MTLVPPARMSLLCAVFAGFAVLACSTHAWAAQHPDKRCSRQMLPGHGLQRFVDSLRAGDRGCLPPGDYRAKKLTFPRSGRPQRSDHGAEHRPRSSGDDPRRRLDPERRELRHARGSRHRGWVGGPTGGDRQRRPLDLEPRRRLQPAFRERRPEASASPSAIPTPGATPGARRSRTAGFTTAAAPTTRITGSMRRRLPGGR